MGKTIIEYDSCVPTDSHPNGMALWWLAINIGTDKEDYTSFICKPTERQIRQFKKESKSNAINASNVKDNDMIQGVLQEEPALQIDL